MSFDLITGFCPNVGKILSDRLNSIKELKSLAENVCENWSFHAAVMPVIRKQSVFHICS